MPGPVAGKCATRPSARTRETGAVHERLNGRLERHAHPLELQRVRPKRPIAIPTVTYECHERLVRHLMPIDQEGGGLSTGMVFGHRAHHESGLDQHHVPDVPTLVHQRASHGHRVPGGYVDNEGKTFVSRQLGLGDVITCYGEVISNRVERDPVGVVSRQHAGERDQGTGRIGLQRDSPADHGRDTD